MSDYWSLSYKNIPVWGYLKFYFTDKEESPYRVETISYWKSLPSSFFFLFVFIFLRLRRVNVVTCLISRKEIDDFVSFYMGETSRVKFFRPENNKGNTLFIELVWYLYRRFGYLLDLLGYKRLVQDLGDLGVDNKESVKKAKLIVGDYYYNYFISFFLKGKEVYYSNCIVPKIEKYMGLMNSIEVQHGIIYRGHPDYTSIPNGKLKDKLLVWNERWKDKLVNEVGYSGRVIFSDYLPCFRMESLDLSSGEVLVFTTVSKYYEVLINNSSVNKLYIQCHPRDRNEYHESISRINNANPFNFKKVFVHDSTIILSLLESGCFFTYLKTKEESVEEIKTRLYSKYSAEYGKNYTISKRIEL